MTPQIRIAREAGVCYGVERALKLASEASKAAGKAATLGPLIHNPRVVAELTEAGIRVVQDPEALAPGETLIIRTHGAGATVLEAARARAVEVIDATCPYVRKVQQAAGMLSAQGYTLVIIGEPDHPEVIGVRSHAGADVLVIASPDDLPDGFSARKVGVVVQTTQTLEALQAIVVALTGRCQELRVYNTICDATTKRQEAAREVAEESEVMIVIGGKNSGNTTRLAEISREAGARTYHIESPEELESAWLSGAARIGVTAGASTPAEQLDAVVARIRELCS